MLFEVRAADASMHMTTLKLDATDAADARQQALRLKLAPVAVKAVQALQRPATQARSGFQLSLFAEELQMLLGAGLSLIDAIEGLAERQAHKATHPLYTALATALRQGDSLSAALARQPDAFPALFVGVVRAAERTSSLPASLSKYVAYELHLRLLRERLVSAAIYPAILLLAGGGVTLFLLTYVVPQFSLVYQSSGRPLPAVSQALMAIGAALAGHGFWVLGGCLAAGLLAVATWRGLGTALGWLQLLAWLPGAAPHITTMERARLYRTLGMLLEGGLTVRDALGLARGVMAAPSQAALDEVGRSVLAGLPLSEGLHRAGLSTPLALRLVQVGERSGQLGPMLERAAEFHEHETALWVERFSKTFGPLLMVLISLLVGAVVVFLYIPIFDLAGSLQ